MKLIQYPKGIVYLLLFSAYFVTNVLFPAEQGNMVSSDDGNRIYPQLCLVSVVFYSALYIVRHLSVFTLKWYFSPFWQYLLMSMVYAACYVAFPGNEMATPFESVVHIVKVTASIFVLYGFYLVARYRPQDVKYLYAILLLQVIYSVIFLVMDYYSTLLKSVTSPSESAFDSNAGFMLASLIPMCFVLPKGRFRIYLYFFLVAITLFSGQRAAAVAAVVSLFFAVKFIKSDLKRFDIYLFSILFLVAIGPLLMIAVENIMLRNAIDTNSGGFGSGRSEFWQIVLYSYFDSSIWGIVLGHGLFSVNDLLLRKYGIPIGAHNGYLDHLYIFGLIGFVLYLRCYLVFLRVGVYLKKLKSEYYIVALMMLFMLVVRSGASHGNFDISYIPFFATLSIILAKYPIKEVQNR